MHLIIRTVKTWQSGVICGCPSFLESKSLYISRAAKWSKPFDFISQHILNALIRSLKTFVEVFWQSRVVCGSSELLWMNNIVLRWTLFKNYNSIPAQMCKSCIEVCNWERSPQDLYALTLLGIVPNYQSHDGRHCLIYLGYVGTKKMLPPLFLDHWQSTGTDS